MNTQSYLERARAFQCEREESEISEVTTVGVGLSSLSSLISRSQDSATKVQMLARSNGATASAWRGAILAGISYAKAGSVSSASIQEDIEVWKELAARHGWPDAPEELPGFEENEQGGFI